MFGCETPSRGEARELGRLSVAIGPQEAAILGRRCGGASRAEYARELIERVLNGSFDAAGLLHAQPIAPLPDGVPAPRLDVRMSKQTRKQFGRWCRAGGVRLGDALRSAIHADEAGLLRGRGRRESSAMRPPAPAPTREPARREAPASGASTSSPAPAPRPPARSQPPRRPVAAEPAKLDALDLLAARVRTSGGSTGWLVAEVERADDDETAALIEKVSDEVGAFLYVEHWSEAAGLEIAQLIAYGGAGSEIAILVGVGLSREKETDDETGEVEEWSEPTYVGLDEPGRVADELVRIVRRLGRDAEVVARVHRLINDDGVVVGIVEFQAEVQ